ncbi:MAG: trypsin-like peptidase domain-containing protein [Planctomycetota bacterium]
MRFSPTAPTLLLSLLLFGVLAPVGASLGQDDDLDRLDRNLRNLADRLRPSVVEILVLEGPSSPVGVEEGEPPRVLQRASGLVASSRGEVVTILDALVQAPDRGSSGAPRVRVNFHDGSTSVGSLLGRDSLTGITLLQTSGERRRPVRVSSRPLAVGSTVVSVGADSFSLGVVSDPARGVSLGGYEFPRGVVTSIPAGAGARGGVLADVRGRLVGILAYSLVDSSAGQRSGQRTVSPAAGASPGAAKDGTVGSTWSAPRLERRLATSAEGDLVAIPSDLLLRILRDLRKEGVVQRGAIGAGFKLFQNSGRRDTDHDHDGDHDHDHRWAGHWTLCVESVTPGGAAAAAGLVVGDLIQSVGGREIRESADLLWFQELVEFGRIGSILKLQVLRLTPGGINRRSILLQTVSSTREGADEDAEKAGRRP